MNAPPLVLVHPNDPDAAYDRELRRLLSRGQCELADAIERAHAAWLAKVLP